MSTAAIVAAAQGIVQAALQAAGETSLTVTLGVPKVVNTDTVAYLWDDGYSDVPKARGWVRRSHVVPIHLMLLSTGDDAAAEAKMMALTDAIGAAFYTNHALSGAAQTSALVQRGGPGGGPQASAVYVLYQNGEYRHRWWTLEATEDVFLVFA